MLGEVSNSTRSILNARRERESGTDISREHPGGPETRKALRGTFSVLIVDRDPMSSDLLANALEQQGSCRASAVPSSHLFAFLDNRTVELVVMSADVKAGSENALGLTRRLRQRYPKTNVVIIVGESSRRAVLDAFRAGAVGVFSRELPVSELLDCVQHVSTGRLWAGHKETCVLMELFRSMPAPLMTESGQEDFPLTGRELQVVQHAATGKTNRMIAMELRLSEHTVKNYLFKAFEKLGVSSRIELLFYLTMRGHALSVPSDVLSKGASNTDPCVPDLRT